MNSGHFTRRRQYQYMDFRHSGGDCLGDRNNRNLRRLPPVGYSNVSVARRRQTTRPVLSGILPLRLCNASARMKISQESSNPDVATIFSR